MRLLNMIRTSEGG